MSLKSIHYIFLISTNINFVFYNSMHPKVQLNASFFGEPIGVLEYWQKTNTLAKEALEKIDDLIKLCQHADINDLGIVLRSTFHHIKIIPFDYYSAANSSNLKDIQKLEQINLHTYFKSDEVEKLKNLQKILESAESSENFFDKLVEEEKEWKGINDEKTSLIMLIVATPTLRKIYKKRTAQKRASRLLRYYLNEFFFDKSNRFIWHDIIKRKNGYKDRFQKKLASCMNWDTSYIKNFLETNDQEELTFWDNRINSIATLHAIAEELILCSEAALEWWQDYARRFRNMQLRFPQNVLEMFEHENFLPLQKPKAKNLFPFYFDHPLP